MCVWFIFLTDNLFSQLKTLKLNTACVYSQINLTAWLRPLTVSDNTLKRQFVATEAFVCQTLAAG